MPKEYTGVNLNCRYVPSIFDDEAVKKEKDTVIRHMDQLLGNFATGLNKTPEGREAFEFFSGKGFVGGTNIGYIVTEMLRKAGITKEEVPTVNDMLEAGNHVIIRDEEGKLTTFTDRFFRNDTVKELAEQETNDKSFCGRGMLLAAFMGAFFAEMNHPELKNYRVAFGEKTPEKVAAYVSDGRSPVTAIVDEVSRKEFDKSIDSYNEAAMEVGIDLEQTRKNYNIAQKAYDEAIENYTKVMTAFTEKYPEEVPVPVKPIEKSSLRRFFNRIGLAKHSKEYDAEMKTYYMQAEKRGKYDENVKLLQDAIKAVERKNSEMHAVEQQFNFTSRKDGETMKEQKGRIEANEKTVYVMRSMTVIPKMSEYAKKLEEKQTAKRVSDCLSDPAILRAVENNSAMTFRKGGLVSMMHLINRKGKDSYTVLAADMMAINMPEAVQDAKKQMQGRQMAPAKMRDTAKMLLTKRYEAEIRKSESLFHKTFHMVAMPENVQRVMDAVHFENIVKERLRTVEHRSYEGDVMLPKVNKHNVGDMTHLLMSSFKTDIKEGFDFRNSRWYDRYRQKNSSR